MNEDNTTRTPDKTPTWVMNEHGVRSCWPATTAIKLVQENYGWKFCDAEEVPTQKQYPIGTGELTAAGLERRLAARELAKEAKANMTQEDKVEEVEQLSLSDLRTRAKRLGVDKYWVKSEARLLKEVTEKELSE